MIRSFLPLILATAICGVGRAQLAVTEAMTGEVDANHPDWFELHNYGAQAIDLTGYSFNDDSHGGFSGADSASFNGIIIHPGETILVTEQKGVVTDAASFLTWWGLTTNQVVVLNPADPGLSASGDSIRLWNTNLAALGSKTNGLDLEQCPDFLVQRVDTGATVSQSLLYDPTNGLYDLLSSNGVAGAFTSNNGEVGSPGIAPAPVTATISQKPQDQSVAVGDTVTFTNAGLALPPLQFHWFFKNAPITSQTPGVSIHYSKDVSTVVLSDVQTTNGGTYTVIADNGLQHFTNSAVLTVNTGPIAPTILSVAPSLQSFDAYLGQTVNFAVTASGFPAPAYQWRKDGADIAGETRSQFALSLTDTNQSGTYSVIVSNSVSSTNASFAVRVTPVPNLVITEVMSGESTNNANGDTSGHGDWFELSNLGSFPVNLAGFRIDDSHASLAQSTTITNQATIQPGESVVFVQDMTPQAFRDWWGTNLPPTAQVLAYSGKGQGLSGSGDAVNVWNAVATDNLDTAASVSFLAGTNGVSFGFNPSISNETGFLGFAPDGLSTNGVNGAFVAAVGGDIGSPGTIVNLPTLVGITRASPGWAIAWVNQPNWRYTVQYKDQLNAATWTTLTNVTSDSSSVFRFVDSNAGAQRFYRVGLAP
ncbi:MAG TPA: lamin tail domain-containing protein [Verrucomicrobiae bacterium]|nr:lamin tail domain-containing protein [Verrucomicrobiae bacterium]